MSQNLELSARTETDGDETRAAITTAVDAVSNAIGSTLGPNGTDKMLISERGTVVVTNDGAMILDRMDIEGPVGRTIERMAGAQADAVGDGATTTVVLTAALLNAAESLRRDGVHPTTIIDGYTEAATHARDRLPDYGRDIDRGDETRLRQVAETAVTGRWDDVSVGWFGDLTVRALRGVDFDPSNLSVKSYPGGELRDSRVLDGLLIDTDTSSTSTESACTRRSGEFREPAVAMVDDEVGVDTPDCLGSVELESPEQVSEFRAHERTVRSDIVERLLNVDADVLVSQKSVDDTVRNRLSERGILTVERTRQDEFDAIARMTDSSPVQSAGALESGAVGSAESVASLQVGPARTLLVCGTTDETRTSLLLRGGTEHVAEEVRRIVGDCIDVVRLALRDGLVLPGGGAAAITLAESVFAHAKTVRGREQLAVEAFADALEQVPRTLVHNAGQDPLEVLPRLRRRHGEGERTVGVGVGGEPEDMVATGVIEPATVFYNAVGRAAETAAMLLRIDDILDTETPLAGDGDEFAGAESESGHGDHDHDHGHHDTGGYPWAVSH